MSVFIERVRVDILQMIESLTIDSESLVTMQIIARAIDHGSDIELQQNMQTCDMVVKFHLRIERGLNKQKPLKWWERTFEKGKIVRNALKNKRLEPQMSNRDRGENLTVLDNMLFFVKTRMLIHNASNKDTPLTPVLEALLMRHLDLETNRTNSSE